MRARQVRAWIKGLGIWVGVMFVVGFLAMAIADFAGLV